MAPNDFQGFDMVRKWVWFIGPRHFSFSACFSIDQDTEQEKNEGKNKHFSHDWSPNCSSKSGRKTRRKEDDWYAMQRKTCTICVL